MTFLISLITWAIIAMLIIGFAMYLFMAIKAIMSGRPIRLPWYGWLQAGDGK